MTEASELLVRRVIDLFAAVQRRAIEHRDTPMVGRSHGMWAEPTTFGHKLAGWGFELVRACRRLQAAAHSVAYGKISGAVGTHATVPATVEERVTAALGISPEPAATQVVGRDRHAAFLTTLAGVGATLERIATEIRHLQRSEVGEVAEPFAESQKGSSAMPHKHNPILSENVVGISRLLRGWAVAALEDVALWHERDISHSSVERVAIPDACLTLDFALVRLTRVVDGMRVDVDRMRANLETAGGMLFSHRLLLSLIRSGLGRDEAYRRVQSASAEAMRTGADLREAFAGEVGDEAFSLEPHLAGAAASVDHLAGISVEWLRERPSG